jgi:hypothetical protein
MDGMEQGHKEARIGARIRKIDARRTFAKISAKATDEWAMRLQSALFHPTSLHSGIGRTAGAKLVLHHHHFHAHAGLSLRGSILLPIFADSRF